MGCDIVFKADGTVEGAGSSAEGKFMIKGVYNLCSGIVAWRQVTSSSHSCAKSSIRIAAEFYGEVSKLQGRTQITGTFLTIKGRYCVMKLRSTCEKERAIANTGNVGSLPTLLTGSMIPRKEGKENKSSIFLNDASSMVDSETQTEAAFAEEEAAGTQEWRLSAKKMDSETQMQTIHAEEEAGGKLEVASEVNSETMEAATKCLRRGESRWHDCGTLEVSSRLECEVRMEGGFAVFADSEPELKEPGCTPEVSSWMDPETKMEAAFAVLNDSEPKDEEVGGAQQYSLDAFDHFYPKNIDSRMEAAFAVFDDSDFEDDEA